VAKEYCTYVDCGRRSAAPVPPRDMISGKDVVDVGCGYGRTLWEFQSEARSAVGVEPQEEFVILGRALSDLEKKAPPKIIVGVAESLDRFFAPESVDLVFSRLALSYTSVTLVLEKIIKILRPSGHLWIQVDSPSVLPRSFLSRRVSMRRKGWMLLALLNLPVCILTGRQISVSAGSHSPYPHRPVFLPLWWWRRKLQGYGLRNFQLHPGSTLIFSAQK
jgi:SAM-dependent methyltransferase